MMMMMSRTDLANNFVFVLPDDLARPLARNEQPRAKITSTMKQFDDDDQTARLGHQTGEPPKLVAGLRCWSTRALFCVCV